MIGRRSGSRRRDERGYVAIVTALFVAGLGLGLGAVGVDVARLYVQANQVQKVADISALGAVTYLPQDLPSAVTDARAIAARNGFDNASADTDVTVGLGDTSSQLSVTICQRTKNAFASAFGAGYGNVCRTAVADYSGPAPMGSPCNTFGNEPTSGSGGSKTAAGGVGTSRGSSPFPNCATSNPSFWGTVEGPQTDKGSGDRYSTKSCAAGTAVDGCAAGTSNNNSEYDSAGYFWLVRVQPAAVGKTIDLQLYDPSFVYTNSTCTGYGDTNNFSTATNPYADDPGPRYGAGSGNSSTGAPFCSGDYYPGGFGGGSTPKTTTNSVTTSFALRQQTDTLNPRTAPVQNDSVTGLSCIKQYKGTPIFPVPNDMYSKSTSYDQGMASVFHNWSSLCKFIPARAGDYYLQVRTNVALGGTAVANTNSNDPVVYTGNTAVLATNGNTTTGYGDNSFGIRAVTPAGLEKTVSVSGYDRMPIFINATAATAKFNLIRILPGGAGKSISFSYFDAGDAQASGTGSVRVITPADATGSITSTPFPRGGCTASGGYAGTGPTTLTSCTAPFTMSTSGGSNNGKLETIVIPIPDDYTCDYTVLSNCWYQVEVKFPTGVPVNDITTWTASVFGEPVRLVD